MRISMHGKENEGFATQKWKFHRALAFRIVNSQKNFILVFNNEKHIC